MDLVSLNQMDFSPLFFFPVAGIFGTIFSFAKKVVGTVLGGQKTTSSSANFQNLYQQSQQQIYNLQAQLAQKKQMNWTPIILIGGMALVAIFLFKR
ncbi:hypothetical protein ES702_06837 [subsurface metagenome]